MKAQQQLSSTQSTIAFIQNPQKQVECSKGKVSTHVCSNKNCHQYAFVCQDRLCQCKIHHKLCLQSRTDKIIETLRSKSYHLQSIKTKIEDMFDKSIDQLSQTRDRILKQFKQANQLKGLDEQQLTLVRAHRSADTKDITCNFMWNIILKMHDSSKNSKKIQKIQKQINNLWISFSKDINDFQKELSQGLQNINKPNEKQHFKSSKVIRKIEDQYNLINYFPKKIKSAELLYRASENGFQTSKFHAKCDNHNNTLTICQTQFDKIIGGFTALRLSDIPDNKYKSDPLGRSFLFSLTYNQKLMLSQKRKQFQILHAKNCGPAFGGGGGGCDIVIKDKSNQKQDSFTSIGNNYVHSNYTNGSDQSKRRFAGGNNFKTKQWEVWKLQFQN